MKIGDLVRTPEGKLGIITKYYSGYDNSSKTSRPHGACHGTYPWYVSIMPDWSIEYFRTEQLEVINENR